MTIVNEREKRGNSAFLPLVLYAEGLKEEVVKTKKMMLGFAAVAMAVTMAGCGEGTSGETRQVGPDDGHYERIEVTVEGDQTVKCIKLDVGRQGGLSCNWEEYNAKYGDTEKK